MEKICTKCKFSKLTEDGSFYWNSTVWRSSCKECDKQSKRLAYPKRAEEKRLYQREYYKSNKEKCSLQMKNWRIVNWDKERDRKLKRSYGIGLQDFNEMFSKQGQECAICHTKDPGKKEWSVDHDHNTGEVRGILCGNCNLALGNFKDNLDSLHNAIIYLDKRKRIAA